MATADPTPVGLSDDPRINGLMEPSNWVSSGSLELTWSPHNSGGFWVSQELTYVQAAFDAWSNVANISFTRVPATTGFRQTQADLAVVASGTRLQQFDEAIGLAFTPDPFFTDFDLMGETYNATNYPRSQGDIFLDDADSGSFAPGGSGFATILHEIGHALGFKHPHDQPRTFTGLGIGRMDNLNWTVMSYNHPHGFNQPLEYGWPVTPMPIDILAIQHIYGANMSYRAGDSTYVLVGDTGKLMTLWDAGGTDLLDASRVGFGMTISLQSGAFNAHGDDTITAIAFKVTIEKAWGTNFSDQITGNDADNILVGRGGDDTVVGVGGADRILGGIGTDALAGGNGNDWLEGAENRDTMEGGNGHDRMDGGPGADEMLGGPGNDLLEGDAGHDSLGGNTGNDILTGGGGNDAISGGDGSDELNGSAGNDELLGGPGNDRLDGGPGNDTLAGGSGNDWLSGGTGIDTLDGGVGRDVFLFSNLPTPENLDTIQEFEGAGAAVGDLLYLDATRFDSLTPGALDATHFISGIAASAENSDDFLLYDPSSGVLYYDSDGDGPGLAVQFAELSGSPDALSAADFVVV